MQTDTSAEPRTSASASFEGMELGDGGFEGAGTRLGGHPSGRAGVDARGGGGTARLHRRTDYRSSGRFAAASSAARPGFVGRGLVLSLPSLRRVAGRLTSNRADAADLVQMTCVRVLEKSGYFTQGSLPELTKWLVTVLVNLHRDNVRKRRREVLRACLDEAVAPEPPALPAWRALGDEDVAVLVGELRPNLREPYLLYAVDRVSYADIAVRLGIPIATVATRIFRARACLRAALRCDADAMA